MMVAALILVALLVLAGAAWAIEYGHQAGRSFEDQNGNCFMNGNAFIETTGVLAADGSVESVLTNLQGVIHFTKGSALAATIKLPTTGDDDGKVICCINESGFAHVLTQSTDGFNGKGSSGTITWNTTKGNAAWLYARNGHWWVAAANGITIA